MVSKKQGYYLITYRDPKDGKILTLDAKNIGDSSLGLGFVAISGFMFDSSKLVVTPDEEALQKRLENVKTLHLSIYAILSVCEMGQDHKGLKFKKNKSNVVMFPSPSTPAP